MARSCGRCSSSPSSRSRWCWSGFSSSRAANWELKRFNRGPTILDTTITLTSLLGLLGTVTGMLRGAELGTPSAIIGGLAEALIATAFGLGIAITALLPFNYLNVRLDRAAIEAAPGSHHGAPGRFDLTDR